MLFTAFAFCQFLIFANGVLYPKLGKYVGKLKYEMSFKNTKVVLRALENINTGLFKMDCELALEKVVEKSYEDDNRKSNDPIVDIYIYTVSLSRPRVEVLEEMRDEMQHCKSYAIERINEYLNASEAENSRRNPTNLNETDPIGFSPNFKNGNPLNKGNIAMIDKTRRSNKNSKKERKAYSEELKHIEGLLQKLTESLEAREKKNIVAESEKNEGRTDIGKMDPVNATQTPEVETEDSVENTERNEIGKGSLNERYEKKKKEGKEEGTHGSVTLKKMTKSDSTSKRSSDNVKGRKKDNLYFRESYLDFHHL